MFQAPNIWYLARIELASGGVIGGTVPGAPLVMVGRSSKLGWGLASSYMDDQDLYIEKLDPENPDQYLTPDGFKPFRTDITIFLIMDLDPITLTLRWTENGPVLPGTHYDLAAVTPPGHVASLAWTALSGNDTTMTAAMALTIITTTVCDQVSLRVGQVTLASSKATSWAKRLIFSFL